MQRSDRNAYSLPSANLSPERRLDFAVGNSFFRNPWVIAPSTTTARDGLGPLFNTNACQNCHVRDGRGHPPEPDDSNAVGMLVRLSILDQPYLAKVIERLGVVPEPVYGTQLQDMAIPGVAPEGKVRVSYTQETVSFKDGHQGRAAQANPADYPARLWRDAPRHPFFGAGSSADDRPGPARSHPRSRPAGQRRPGRPQPRRHSRAGRTGCGTTPRARTVVGRFGWKAGQPNVNQQNVHAFVGDMGLTSTLRPKDDCTPAQADCLAAPNGDGADGEQEVSDNILRLVTFYTRNLAVPARRDVGAPPVLAGKNLFYQAGCQRCHTPQFTTAADAAEPELANQVIRPYSDLLLHDMGPGLADERTEFAANGQDWRTPPLWGVGLNETVSGHSQFLHDGRARNLLEAVLWHGGEADAARNFVLTFNAEQRAALLAFLNSL